MEWEEVVKVGTDILQRVPVPGGWLYRNIILDEKQPEVWETTVRLCFVPASGLPVAIAGSPERPCQ